MLIFSNPGGEYVMPEKGYFFFERALAADHSIHPFFHISRFKAAKITVQNILINRIAALRLDQVFYDVFVALFDIVLQFCSRGPKPGSAHQVGH